MKKNIIYFTIILLITIVPATSLWADYNVTSYLKNKDNKTFQIYLNGVVNGYGWANSHLEFEKRPLMFCQPQNLALSYHNYIDIIDKELKTVNYSKNSYNMLYIENILLDGLIRTFPCTK